MARLMSMKKNKKDHKGGTVICSTAVGYEINAKPMPDLTT